MLGPDSLQSLQQLAVSMADRLPDWVHTRWSAVDRPIEVKPVDPESFLQREGAAPERAIWMRLPSGAGAGLAEQAALLAYLSDYWLAGTAALPHALPMPGPDLFMASLDHAMWFHRPAQVEDWMLFACESPSAQAGRGLSRALIYARRRAASRQHRAGSASPPPPHQLSAAHYRHARLRSSRKRDCASAPRPRRADARRPASEGPKKEGLVETRGIEPLTSAVRLLRSPI